MRGTLAVLRDEEQLNEFNRKFVNRFSRRGWIGLRCLLALGDCSTNRSNWRWLDNLILDPNFATLPQYGRCNNRSQNPRSNHCCAYINGITRMFNTADCRQMEQE